MTAAAWCSGDPGPTRIKICGIRRAEDLLAAADAGAHAIGLVLAAGSPRQVTPVQAQQFAAATPSALTPITLLVDPDEQVLQQRATPWTQLHGDESASVVEASAKTGPVIKAVPWNDPNAIAIWDACPHVTRLLIDSPHGGSGEAFDHEAFANIAATLQTPWILAGGLTPETVAAAIRTLRPWGVDVSSGVESSRGMKDPDLIAAFCGAVRAAGV